MRFGVLGPVEARLADGSPVAVGGPQVRSLLAMLLLDAGRMVSAGRLAAGLYGPDAPDVGHALQSQVSRLRRGLRGGPTVEFGPAGYRLAVDPDNVDAHRFTSLAGQGRQALAAGDPARAAALLGAAHSPSPLSGQGTSLALVGAYVLAGELRTAAGDHRVAFGRYREEMREYVDVNLKLGESNASQMVAGSRRQLRMQNLMMRYVSVLPWKDLALRPILKPLNAAANAITLKDY